MNLNARNIQIKAITDRGDIQPTCVGIHPATGQIQIARWR